MRKKCKQWQTLFSWAPKSLWTVTAAMKLKGACSLEERLEQTWRWKWSHSVMSDCFSPPWTAARQASLSITNNWSLLKLMSISDGHHLILCHPLFLPPSIFPSVRVFSNASVLHITWPKYYWSFSFSISPSNEHSVLISFRIYWLDLLAVQVTLKSLLQHHRSEASILWNSAFFMIQLSPLYMTTEKTIALTIWTFIG